MAVTVSVFAPGCSGTAPAKKVFPDTAAAMPLTVTPEFSGPCTVPVADTLSLPIEAPFAGLATLRVSAGKVPAAVTVKGALVAVPRVLFTVIGPEVAAAGTAKVIIVELAVSTGAGTEAPLAPGNTTRLFAATGSNETPVSPTTVPAGPLAGDIAVIRSAGTMVKVIAPGCRLDAKPVSVRSPAVPAVSEKSALVSPSGRVTVAGNVPLPAPFANTDTASPPAGAGSLETMVTVVPLPSTSVVVGAVRTSATCCFTVSKV